MGRKTAGVVLNGVRHRGGHRGGHARVPHRASVEVAGPSAKRPADRGRPAQLYPREYWVPSAICGCCSAAKRASATRSARRASCATSANCGKA
ncbi:MAG: hypothetical protein ACLTMP_05510 [Eggerthella lenta]